MDDVLAKALLEALQGVFRKHAHAHWNGDPYLFPPEWEQARIAIKAAVDAVEPVERVDRVGPVVV